MENWVVLTTQKREKMGCYDSYEDKHMGAVITTLMCANIGRYCSHECVCVFDYDNHQCV
jgi:hypothetical protein